MSVYTTLNDGELIDFLRGYEAGELAGYQGISEGIENTNYFVDTENNGTRHHFVLTIFESLDYEEIPYFLELTAFMAERGLPCAHPLADRRGRYLQTLKGKAAALVQRLEGRSTERPSAGQCRQAGEVLAKLHQEGREFSLRRNNPRGLSWWEEVVAQLRDKVSLRDRVLLENEVEFQRRYASLALPGGVIHGDLFRDNVLFTDDRLTGLIDFYYACDDSFLYDLAITVNDWCSKADGSLDPRTVDALVGGYTAARPLAAGEGAYWPVMLRAAALRFWLLRLCHLHFPREGVLTQTKDPDVFRRVLEQRIAAQEHLEHSWH